MHTLNKEQRGTGRIVVKITNKVPSGHSWVRICSNFALSLNTYVWTERHTHTL